MADGLTIQMQGFAELDKLFADMGGPTGEAVVRRGLRAGGNVMKAAIAANAPVRPEGISATALPPGALQRDVQVHLAKDKGADGSYSVYIEAGPATIHVSRWVEWGHRLVRGRSSKRARGKQVGDVPAHPYIRPAFDANEDLAVNAVGASIMEDYEKAFKANGTMVEG
jgi:HK97 gp10 family phage protein